MKKKIHPKDQTDELNRAKFETVKRNPEELNEIQKLIEKNEKGLDEYATRRATIDGKCNEDLKNTWKCFASEAFFDKDFKNKSMSINFFPACNTLDCRAGFMAYINTEIMLHGCENLSYMSFDKEKGQYFMTKDVMNEKMLDYLCGQSRQIFTELTSGQPVKHLLVGIDLLRTKSAIEAEVSEQVARHQDMTGTEFENIPEKRLKYLPIVDELFKVWDMREDGKSFQEIKTALSISEDRAKKQFYRAFSIIYDEEYSKDSWMNLLRLHLEKIALTEKPDDVKFWNRVKKMESVYQHDLIPKDIEDQDGNKEPFMDSIGSEQNKFSIIASDLKNICKNCPDKSCQTMMFECLSELAAGAIGALEDLKPDCPKIYNYLKN